MADAHDRELARVRKVCAALPEVTERPSHGSPAWFVHDKKTIAMFVDDHHGDGILGIWCAAPPGVQEQMIDEEPGRLLPSALRRPPRLDRRAPESDGHERRAARHPRGHVRVVAPKTLVARLDGD